MINRSNLRLGANDAMLQFYIFNDNCYQGWFRRRLEENWLILLRILRVYLLSDELKMLHPVQMFKKGKIKKDLSLQIDTSHLCG